MASQVLRRRIPGADCLQIARTRPGEARTYHMPIRALTRCRLRSPPRHPLAILPSQLTRLPYIWVYKTFKSILGEDQVLIKTAENLRTEQPKKKIYSPPKRRFEKPKSAESKPAADGKVLFPEGAAVRHEESGKDHAAVVLEGFPALDEILPEKKQSKNTPMMFKQVSQRTQKRTKQRSVDSLSPTEVVAISKCPWSPNNKSEGADVAVVSLSHSLEETMKLETEYREHIANFSLDKADAEDRAIADLAIVYEVGSNPDERVSIQREMVGEASIPVWSVHTLK